MSRAPVRPWQVAAVVFLGRLPAGGLESWIWSFAQSEFQFKRLQSNAPLPRCTDSTGTARAASSARRGTWRSASASGPS